MADQKNQEARRASASQVMAEQKNHPGRGQQFKNLLVAGEKSGLCKGKNIAREPIVATPLSWYCFNVVLFP